MPLKYSLHDPTLCIVADGDVEYAAGLDVLRAALDDARRTHPPEGTGHWNILFDIRNSSENRGTAELKGIAQVLSEHGDLLTGRMAVVADQPFYYGMGRVFGVFVQQQGQEPRVFSDYDQAMTWLATGHSG